MMTCRGQNRMLVRPLRLGHWRKGTRRIRKKEEKSIELGKKYSIMNAWIGRYLSKDG